MNAATNAVINVRGTSRSLKNNVPVFVRANADIEIHIGSIFALVVDSSGRRILSALPMQLVIGVPNDEMLSLNVSR